MYSVHKINILPCLSTDFQLENLLVKYQQDEKKNFPEYKKWLTYYIAHMLNTYEYKDLKERNIYNGWEVAEELECEHLNGVARLILGICSRQLKFCKFGRHQSKYLNCILLGLLLIGRFSNLTPTPQ